MGRIKAKRNSDETCKSTRQEDRPGTDQDRPTGVPCDRDSGDDSQQYADKPTYQGQDQGFDQELPSDVIATGPDGHSQTDFTGAFGHRNQHDVHDADAANY